MPLQCGLFTLIAVSIGQSAVVILIWFWQIAYTDPYNPLNPIVMRSPNATHRLQDPMSKLKQADPRG